MTAAVKTYQRVLVVWWDLQQEQEDEKEEEEEGKCWYLNSSDMWPHYEPLY